LDTLTKVFVMLARLLFVIELALGTYIWSAYGLPTLNIHIGLGFVMTLVVLVLAVIALARRMVILGVLGVLIALLTPYIGLKQIPAMAFMPSLGVIQVLHIISGLAAIGIAEAIGAKVRKSLRAGS